MNVARVGCVIVLSVAAVSAPARAEMAGAFGNTIISHYPNGQWVKHFFEPDGRYSSQFSDGRHWTARWTAQGDKVCLTNIRPRQLMPRFCTAMVEANVGESWRARDPLGRTVRNELVAGRR
jgi:hypothetical protein